LKPLSVWPGIPVRYGSAIHTNAERAHLPPVEACRPSVWFTGCRLRQAACAHIRTICVRRSMHPAHPSAARIRRSESARSAATPRTHADADDRRGSRRSVMPRSAQLMLAPGRCGGMNISWHLAAVVATILSLGCQTRRTAMYRDRDAEASF
jgi:hypothetical protein